jgi:lysophospholipase L1-like esterase
MGFGAKFPAGLGVLAFGDSFTLGVGASDQAHWYISRFAAYVGGSVNNKAISGTGTSASAKALLSNSPLLRKQGTTILSGFNDIGATGMASIEKIKSNHRAMLAASFLRDAVPASLAPRSSGVWNTLGSSAGGKSFALGGTPMFSDDVGAYLEFDFYGETLVVGAYTQISTGFYNDLNVSIDDGAPTIYLSLGESDDPYPAVGYNANVYRNLGAGKHTVRLSGVSTGKHCVIDYIGTLIDPADAAGVLVGGVPTRTNWTHGEFTTDQATTDAASYAIAGVVAEFPDYPVQYIPIADFYSAADVWTDGYHPSDLGHQLIAQAFRSRVNLW